MRTEQILFMEKKITVLIADDSIWVRHMLKMLIEEMENAELAGEAADGNEVIALASELSPDIILMDINMSPVNGFEATSSILKKDPDAKIIALSLHSQTAYAKKMFELGGKGYVTKSASHTEIIEAIHIVSSGGTYID